ncbi:MAG: RpiB/LacA/LacB family sugar-phosphate isomerase [Clostridia bacterium]|nr:RpiB/LacA/LacB family sugar-phosphate isomerase [Clostridia bacterium]
MKIAVGADKYGFALKESLKKMLEKEGHEVIDCGILTPSDTGIDKAPVAVAEMVASGKADGGILVDETGAASSIIANKVAGIRAAQVGDMYSARLTKAHNLANILCFGSAVTGEKTAEECVKIWLETEFMYGNHSIRLDMLKELEEKYGK